MLKELKKKNELLCGLIAVAVDGGRVVENPTLYEMAVATERDLLVLFSTTEKELFFCSQKTSAQIAHVTSTLEKSALVDFSVSEAEYKIARQEFSQRDIHSHPSASYFGMAYRPGLFLDRDGVVIEEVPHNQNPNLVKLVCLESKN